MKRILLPLAIVGLLLLAACSEAPEGSATSATGPTTTAPAGEETTSTDQGTGTTGGQATSPGGAQEPAGEQDLEVEVVARGLRVPWEMRFLPEGDLLVTERAGRIVRVDLDTGEVIPVGEVPAEERGEGGLMGLALDPDFPDEPYIYVAYTFEADGERQNRVSRFTYQDDRVSGEKVLIDAIPGAGNHNGSRVAFGPDGFLWVTTGDATQGDLAQDRESPAGKVLRVDREGKSAPDNPFSGSPVYSLGHRNAQGLAWHPSTGQAFVTEHGPNSDDEVNRLQVGGNYGWPEVGGAAGDERFVDPIMSWTPTIAPAGAVFYDADEIPGWRDAFLFVTLKDRDLRLLLPADEEFAQVAREQVLFDGRFGRLRAIAVGPDGALYIATSNRDGRGVPDAEDDRILRITFTGAGGT